MGSSRRILLVDDHLDTLRLFETYLTLSGFEVTASTSATEALRHVKDGFDAIATDLAMPGMDGVEFIQRTRERRESQIPIVAITGQPIYAETTTRQHIDCCRLLTKPCDIEQLCDLLRSLPEGCTHACDQCPNRIEKIVVDQA